MCGRFAMDSAVNAEIEELVAEHGLGVLDDLDRYIPRFNIKPTNRIPIILQPQERGEATVTAARWGLIPPWVKSVDAAPRTTFNARSESAMTSESSGRASMWRTPLTKGRRCLIPASGYFEWAGPKNRRVPHWIHPNGVGPLMFAGLYGWWSDPAASEDDPTRARLTCTILTMESVPELAGIHDRNPVALPRSVWWDWIDPEVEGSQSLVDEMVAEARPVLAGLAEYEVARFGRDDDGPDLIRRVRPE